MRESVTEPWTWELPLKPSSRHPASSIESHREPKPAAETATDRVAEAVSIAFVRQALQAAARGGHPAAPLLAIAQIEPELVEDAASRVSPTALGSLWLATARVLDDEFFGLDSRRMKVGSFATLARFGLQARNLREALLSIAQFFRILLDDTRVEFSQTPEEAVIQFVETPGRLSVDRVFAHETLLVLIHGLACWLIARRIPVEHASFAYPAPAWGEEYKAAFSPSLEFGAARTRLVFDALLLETPVVQTTRTLPEFLRGAPGNFILKYRNENSLSSRVRRHLRALQPSAWPSFEALADSFHLGTTTLRRRLEREGTSFSTIREAVRRDLAIGYLQGTDMSIVDIALALGFAEPSAFHRAFKQWTGVRPGAYREDARKQAVKRSARARGD